MEAGLGAALNQATTGSTQPHAFFALGFDGGVERVPASDLASEARGSARVSSVHRFELVDQRRCPATIRRDKGEESLAEIGRS